MSTIAEYLESLRGKSVAVIGMGVSNTPLIRMMLRAGLKVTVCDKSPRERVEELAAELESLGASFQLGENYLDKLYRFDVIFRTPGLSPNHPELKKAAEKGREITSEMEVFFQVCPCKTIAVTGSDGKTTTTTIIAELLKAAGQSVYVGGNIGKPLLPDVDGEQVPAFEVMQMNSAIRSMIRDGKNHQIDNAIAAGSGEGMLTMDQSILALYQAGRITRETALNYADNPEQLRRRMGN